MNLISFRYYLLAFFLIFWNNVFCQDVLDFDNLKLTDAIDIALKNNKKLRLQQINTNTSLLQEKDLSNAKIPEINFLTNFHVLSNLNQYEQGITHSSTTYEVPRIRYNFTLDAKVPIYTGGKIKFEQEKASVETDIQKLKSRREERDVKMQVISCYLQGLHLKQQQKLINEKMHEDSLVIRQTEKLKQNGVVTNNDVLRTKLQLSNHQMAFSELEREYVILVHQVKTILALPENVNLSISTDHLLTNTLSDDNFEELLNIAHNENEILTIAQKDIDLKNLDKKIVKSNILPKISAGAEYGFNYPNFLFFPTREYLYRVGSVGVNLKMPISNFYTNKVKMKIANEKIVAANLELESKKEQLNHDVYAANKRLDEANKKIKIAEQAIEQASENYRIVRLKYSNQLSLITELIDADNSFLEAQSNLISLQINKQLKYYQLQYVLGNL